MAAHCQSHSDLKLADGEGEKQTMATQFQHGLCRHTRNRQLQTTCLFCAHLHRFVIYEKGIEGDVDILSPMEVGGLKSPEYLQMNPHGKVRS